jgi:signal peptidase I
MNSRSRTIRQVYRCLAAAAVAVTSYWVISRFVVQSVEVVGQSMVPTLRDSGRYLLNRWVYYLRPPRRADIVVLRDPANGRMAVKRIIGVPGDWVYLRDGRVRLNGQELEEPYLPPSTPTFPEGNLPKQWLRCANNEYIVLGDNRRNSTDSRSYGPVARRDLLGRIFP